MLLSFTTPSSSSNRRAGLIAGGALGALLLLGLLGERSAQAIPAFAREYNVACSTCHTMVTRRNEFGDAFRRAGYHWPGGDAADQNARAMPPLEMKGQAVGTGLLPARPPIALVTTFSGSWTDDLKTPNKTAVGTPSLNLVFGGPLSKHIGFFGAWAGGGAPSELSFTWTRPIKNRPELNFRFGLFEQSTTLFKNNESLLGGYQLGTSTVSGHAVSMARIGGEATGLLWDRTSWAAGWVANQGAGAPQDVYYQLSHRFGGISFTGKEREVDLDSSSLLDDLSVTVSHWGYYGRIRSDSGITTQRPLRFGLDTQVRFKSVSAWAGAMLGNDRYRATPDKPAWRNHSLTWFAEGDYFITPWLALLYVYQYQDASSLRQEIQVHQVGLVGIAMENLRVRLKANYTPDRIRNDGVDLQVLLAF
jgi:hypothetical protein